MHPTRGFQSDISYLKSLAGAGLNGIADARDKARGQMFTPQIQTMAWKSAAAGALVGACGTRLAGNRKPSSIALGGVAGTLLAVSATAAWSSRRFTASAARSAIQFINAARDAHWLETNPIDYA